MATRHHQDHIGILVSCAVFTSAEDGIITEQTMVLKLQQEVPSGGSVRIWGFKNSVHLFTWKCFYGNVKKCKKLVNLNGSSWLLALTFNCSIGSLGEIAHEKQKNTKLAFFIFIMNSSLMDEESWSCIIAPELRSIRKLEWRQGCTLVPSHQVEILRTQTIETISSEKKEKLWKTTFNILKGKKYLTKNKKQMQTTSPQTSCSPNCSAMVGQAAWLGFWSVQPPLSSARSKRVGRYYYVFKIAEAQRMEMPCEHLTSERPRSLQTQLESGVHAKYVYIKEGETYPFREVTELAK